MEIGGYFELEQLVSQPYYSDLIELNTARNALIYIMKAKQIRKLYLPSYICGSVTDVLNQHQFAYEFYPVGEDFLPEFKQTLKDNEYLYIVNYYGQLTDDVIKNYKTRFTNIIVDYSHAFFQRPLPGVDTLYSCRKYVGVPDGAYLATDTLLAELLETDQSRTRMSYLLGRYEGRASDYFQEYKQINDGYDQLPLRKMSQLTKNLLGAIDYAAVIQQRNENYAYLHDRLGQHNPLKLITPEAPFAYPYYVENGFEVKRKLIEQKIYISTLWPNVMQDNPPQSTAYKYAANILPLPCDQRYGLNEMAMILTALDS